MQSQKRFVVAAAVAAIVGATVAEASAQTVWTQQDGRASVELELLHPNFSNELDFTFATSAGFVTARVPVTSSLGVVADLPFSRAGWDGPEGSGSSSLIGNPYVGAEWNQSDAFTAELGMRLPFAELDNLEKVAPMLVGMVGELERVEAFAPETLGLYAIANYRHRISDQVTMRLRGGPSFIGGDGGPDDVLVSYTGQIWYGKNRFNIGTGLTGRANVTTDDEEIDRTAHQVVLAGNYGFKQLRPGVQVRLPVDKAMRDAAGSTVGVSLSYSFR